jgi:opacity protein-like surface antigen
MLPYSVRRALAVALLGALPVGAACADDALGLYVGGAIGQSRVQVDSLDFSSHDFGWKAVAGARPFDWFAGEVEYADLGRPHSVIGIGSVSTKATGPAAFALGFLPLPVPLLDVYGKAGVANIQQTAVVTLGSGASACAPGVTCDGFSRTESEFAWGVGAQVKTGALAVRAEFEQFRASGGNLNFASVGLFWTFR